MTILSYVPRPIIVYNSLHTKSTCMQSVPVVHENRFHLSPFDKGNIYAPYRLALAKSFRTLKRNCPSKLYRNIMYNASFTFAMGFETGISQAHEFNYIPDDNIHKITKAGEGLI